MNVVDSSGWIEYLSGGANASFFCLPIESDEPLVVPSISLFEVYRHMLRHIGRDEALEVVAAMRRGYAARVRRIDRVPPPLGPYEVDPPAERLDLTLE